MIFPLLLLLVVPDPSAGHHHHYRSIICALNEAFTPEESMPVTYTSIVTWSTNLPPPRRNKFWIGSGLFTCKTPGLYTITYSGSATIGDGNAVNLCLCKNGEMLPAGSWDDSTSATDSIQTQGARTLVKLVKITFQFSPSPCRSSNLTSRTQSSSKAQPTPSSRVQ